ncbi:MAG: PDZ domain-containing protein [Gammaproteobacteria bacterium]|nr:PDZ domain-containing protein [Gammaproteobacteria bacterium]
MSNFTRNTLIGALGMLMGVMLALVVSVHAERENTSADRTIPMQDIRALSEVFGKIKDNYVEPVSDKTLLDNAIRGMLAGLDPHSTYLDKEAFQELRVGTTGEFGGLGIVVGMEDGFVKVVSPIDDTPAQRAGIKTGDLIIRLDNKPVKGMTLDEAVKLMRGKPGTKITLLVVREGQEKPLTFVLTRDRIRVQSVKSRMLEDGYGYVRISQFQERTAIDMRKAITKLKNEGKGKLKGLILDLRNNPGGLLDAAVDVADTFVTSGTIVSVRGRNKENDVVHSATPNDMLKGAPMIVLVNGGSASASEIVSGALQDDKRAIIMGSKTFGKGSVQTVVPLGNDTAIKLTTARYYTPSGRSIQAEGIEPDIKLDDLKVAEVKQQQGSIKEADLEGHLINDKDNGKHATKDDKKERIDLAKEDYALYEALNVLKGMAFLEHH